MKNGKYSNQYNVVVLYELKRIYNQLYALGLQKINSITNWIKKNIELYIIR